MQDVLGESLRKLRKFRVRKIRMIAILLVLSLAVSLDVFWWLRQPGLTLAGDADCGIVEHTHDDSCQGTETPCNLIEHVHDISCYSDDTADVETQLDWQKMFADYPYTGNLRSDLVGIAKTQVGYTESKLNFQVGNDGIRRGYTRYGAWYGTPYSDWSATFVSFCLHYAGANQLDFPYNTGAASMAEQWKKLGKFALAENYKPSSGDLIFFKDNTVGIVSETQLSSCYVIRGDYENVVKTVFVSYGDDSILGWGTVNKQISGEELYDISKGPSVFIFADGIVNTKAQTYNLRSSRTINDLITYLNDNSGSYYFTLLDTNNRELPKDDDGNFIVHAGTQYKITLTATSPDGFSPGTYQYQFPNGVEMLAGTGDFVINHVTVGNWAVTADGLFTLIFNQEANKLSDVTISATMGIVYPEDQKEVDFDGKINVTIEPPREEIKVTEVQKWGEQGNPDNINTVNKPHKLDPDKIYWTVQIEGNQNSNIPGSKITDRTLKYDWSYEHYYSDTDMAAGLKIGVSIYNPEDGTEEWHTWTVYPGDDLKWTADGWEYTMPETIICNKNVNGTHEQVLGNDHYTYFIEYTSTPTHVDLAGELGYVNAVDVDNKYQEGWGGFIQNEVKAAIFKHGTLVTDAYGAKIVWQIQATVPKKEAKIAEHDWIISDSMSIVNQWGNNQYYEGNDIKISSIAANYFGTIINIPHYSVATENDPYAYELYSWSDGTDNGAEIHILQRCVCTEATCGEWAGQCNPWGYWDGPQYQVTDFCDCWHEVEDTTFMITYETDVTEEIEQYGGLGYSAYNGAGLYSNTTSLWTETTVPLPGIIKKEDRQPEGTLVKYNITVNESKLNLTDGSPLVIHDEMTDTLTFMRGSLVIQSEDAAGNIVTLHEGVDYTYTYDGTGEAVNENGDAVHVLDVTILHPQPVTYILDYNTMLIVQGATSALKYNNTATVSVWGGTASSTSTERVFPDISFASNAFAVMIHKLSADSGESLQGAKFGLFNAQGGLITTGVTGADGKVFFQTDIQNGIVLREHKIYYVQELEAPPGYMLDDTIYEFCFCNQAGGQCDTFDDLKEENELTRVPFDTTGHIDVMNQAITYELPETGGIGTYPLILVSVIFIITPLVYRFIRRRKRERRGAP